MMRIAVALMLFLTLASPISANDKTEVNNENVCWILKQAVALTGSDVDVKCPKKEQAEGVKE